MDAAPKWGPGAKMGALKIFDPCKGSPEKNYKFSSKNSVYMLFYGVDQ